jgi:hypothetical protein
MNIRRFIKIACWVMGGAVVGAIVARVCQTTTGYDCVQCRALRMEHRLFGFSWQTHRDTEFTEWHRVHRGTHRHQWERFTCLGTSSIIYSGQSCGIRHPVCERLPSVFQREFAERADADSLAVFFGGIASTNRELQSQAVQLALERSTTNR